MRGRGGSLINLGSSCAALTQALSSARDNGRRLAIIKRFTVLRERRAIWIKYTIESIDKGQCSFQRRLKKESSRESTAAAGRTGRVHAHEETRKRERERVRSTPTLSQSTKRLLLCKLNAVSITIRPFHWVRFGSPVRPVLCHQGKGNFHKGPLSLARSLARPASQPTDPIHPPRPPPPIRQLPSLHFNNRKLSSRFSYMLLIKRTSPTFFAFCLSVPPSLLFSSIARAIVSHRSPPPAIARAPSTKQTSRSCFYRAFTFGSFHSSTRSNVKKVTWLCFYTCLTLRRSLSISVWKYQNRTRKSFWRTVAAVVREKSI